MKFVLTNFGTVGEVYPLFALAQELQENGHQVLLAISPDYRNWAARLGLDFVPIGPQAQAIQNRLTLAATRDPKIFESVDAVRDLLGPLQESLPVAYEQLRKACGDADVLISGHLQPAAKMVHESTGIPYVSVFSTLIFPGATSAAYQEATQWLVNPFRAALGLPSVADPLAGDALSDQLVLYAVSSHVVGRPVDWANHHYPTGFFNLHELAWQPDNELEEFICSGPAPVVVALGSVVHENAEELTNLLITGFQDAGCRVIFQEGWSGLVPQTTKDVHVVRYVPHEWLFARAACVVHHGGAGTSGAVFRAGVPAIPIPHILDQPFWASRACDLGVAGHLIPLRGLTSGALANAVRDTLDNPSYKHAAVELAKKIREENGTLNARLLIEQMYNGKSQAAAVP